MPGKKKFLTLFSMPSWIKWGLRWCLSFTIRNWRSVIVAVTMMTILLKYYLPRSKKDKGADDKSMGKFGQRAPDTGTSYPKSTTVQLSEGVATHSIGSSGQCASKPVELDLTNLMLKLFRQPKDELAYCFAFWEFKDLMSMGDLFIPHRNMEEIFKSYPHFLTVQHAWMKAIESRLVSDCKSGQLTFLSCIRSMHDPRVLNIFYEIVQSRKIPLLSGQPYNDLHWKVALKIKFEADKELRACSVADRQFFLFLCMQNNYMRVLRFFVQNYRRELHDCTFPNDSNNTPLHVAAKSGNLRMVKYLVETHRCDLACLNRMRQTPLHLAAERGDSEMVQYLVGKMDCDLSMSIVEIDSLGNSPLGYALKGRRHVELARYLVKSFDRFGSVEFRPGWEREIFHGQNLDIIELILQSSSWDIKYKHTIRYAFDTGDAGILDVFFKYHHDYDPGYSFLHRAVENNSLEIVKVLLKYGGRADSVCNTGETAINLARRLGRDTIVALFEEQQKHDRKVAHADPS